MDSTLHAMPPETAIEAAAAASASAVAGKVAYGGAFSMFGGALLSSQAAVLVGMLIGFAGLGMRWYFERKAHALRLQEHRWKRREHEARMARHGGEPTMPGNF